jgi:23S rRNA (cytidine1920-2'-O)/16S rRNA (cytidine1409-2'-O)-methyltransferase
MPAEPLERLDILMFQRGLAPSREKARGMIMAGEVNVNGQRIDKPGTRLKPADEITVKARPPYVSRGGEKLAGALHAFPVMVEGRVCVDVGASTGGFTDCLLQNGAERVYAIDVGYGIMDTRIRGDSRVVVMERTNARYVESLAEPVSLLVCDASFISLKLLLPPMAQWATADADFIVLIKPQFEAGRSDVGKGGVVRERKVHIRVLKEVIDFAQEIGLSLCGLKRSPLVGPAGNIEFLGWFRRHNPTASALDTQAAIVKALADE